MDVNVQNAAVLAQAEAANVDAAQAVVHLTADIEAAINAAKSAGTAVDLAAVLSGEQAEVLLQPLPESIGDTLRMYGLAPTADNLKNAALLLNIGFPVTEANMRLANQALKLFGGDATKAAYLLENQIPPNLRVAEALQNLSEHKTLMADVLTKLFDALVVNPNTPAIGTTDQAAAAAQAQTNSASLVKAQLLLHLLGGGTQAGQGSSTATTPQPAPPQPTAAPPPEQQTVGVNMPPQETAAPAAPAAAPPAAAPPQTAAPATAPPPALDLAAVRSLFSLVKDNSQFETVLSEFIKAYPKEEQVLRQVADKAAGHALPSASTPGEAAAAAPNKTPPALAANPSETAALILRLFPEPEARAVLARTLLFSHPPAALKDALVQKFFLRPEGFTKEEFTALMKGLDTAARAAASAPEQVPLREALPEAAVLRDNLQFMNQLRNDAFVQIPLVFNNAAVTGELYVFKDKKNSAAKKPGTLSALVALDTERLGRFEAYIVKQHNTVSIQFRLNLEDTERLVKAHIGSLEKALEEQGIKKTDISYKKITERFSLLSQEPHSGAQTGAASRYTFDARL